MAFRELMIGILFCAVPVTASAQWSGDTTETWGVFEMNAFETARTTQSPPTNTQDQIKCMSWTEVLLDWIDDGWWPSGGMETYINDDMISHWEGVVRANAPDDLDIWAASEEHYYSGDALLEAYTPESHTEFYSYLGRCAAQGSQNHDQSVQPNSGQGLQQ